MILVSCRGQEMLIQGPTPNPKCKLYISSFLTHSHSLDCLLCAKDIMVIVLLLHMMGGGGGGWEGWGGGSFMLWFEWEDRGWVSYFSYFCSVVNCSFMTDAW